MYNFIYSMNLFIFELSKNVSYSASSVISRSKYCISGNKNKMSLMATVSSNFQRYHFYRQTLLLPQGKMLYHKTSQGKMLYHKTVKCEV